VSGECKREPVLPFVVEDELRDSDGRAGSGGGAGAGTVLDDACDVDGLLETALRIEAGIALGTEIEGGRESGGREISTARDFSLRAGESVRALPLAFRINVCSRSKNINSDTLKLHQV
jgi:hypothetical protein